MPDTPAAFEQKYEAKISKNAYHAFVPTKKQTSFCAFNKASAVALTLTQLDITK